MVIPVKIEKTIICKKLSETIAFSGFTGINPNKKSEIEGGDFITEELAADVSKAECKSIPTPGAKIVPAVKPIAVAKAAVTR